MTRLHDEGHLPTPPECSQDGYDNNAIIRSIPKPQTFLSNAPHFSAADIKFICANMRLYTILIGTSETEKSAPHFRACFTKKARVTKKHVADIPFICVNIRLYNIQFGTSETEISAPHFFGERTHAFCDTVCHSHPHYTPRACPRHPYPSGRRFHIITMRSRNPARSAMITVAGLFMAAAFAEAKPFRRSILAGDEAAEYEWSAVFAVDAAEHTWLMQKVDSEYADQTMKLVTFELDTTPTFDDAAETLNDKTTKANELMAGSCTDLPSGGTIPLSTAGSCVNLKVDNSADDSAWTIDTTDVPGLAIFAQHVPLEFERDTHFLRADEVDVECKAELSPEGGHDHGHAHGDDEEEVKESCACVAGRLGFNIDCTNDAAITNAISYLSTNGICSSCQPSDECVKQFAILQTHHDYCHHEEIPEAAEQEIHDFEAFYEGCSIKRRYDPDLEDCPKGTCSKAKTDLPSQAELDAADCKNDCSSTTCKQYFQDILWAHDNCEHDEIEQIHETALHDLEETCDDNNPTRMCNSAPDTFVRLDYSACPEYSSAGIQRTTAFGMCVTGALLATM